MPYESHPDLATPPDDTVLWRYLDFPKLLDMLERRALWFARLDKLEDPLEGGLTDPELEHLRCAFGATSMARALLSTERTRTSTFVSCWRSGSNESMAMWDIYRRRGCVIAIKSTIAQLKEAIALERRPVYIGEVKYIDYWGDAPWDNNILAMCVRKELAYRHEGEVRAVIWDVELAASGRLPRGHKDAPEWLNPFAGLGGDIPCHIDVGLDPEQLITEVVVGPREGEWVRRMLELVMKRYNLPQQVVRSKLLDPRF